MADLDYTTLFKKKLLETFKFTISLLDKYDLKWYAAAGTCLGAIRHKGMIPWDDDIDIFMPREDYEKFLDLKDSLKGSGFDIVSLRDEGYYTTFGKLINKSTTMWEREWWPSAIIGVYIDVFPLETTELTEDSFHQKYNDYYDTLKLYQRAITKTYCDDFLTLLKQGHLKACWYRMMDPITLAPKKHKLHKDVLSKEHIFDVEGGSQYITPAWMYDIKELYQKEWFRDYVLMPFEDMEIRVPVGYDEYLSYVYGDYMTPPPIEKRVAHHHQFYVNLNECLDKEEILRRKKKGLTFEY